MPRRGAKPKPTVMRKLNGNPTGRPLNNKEAMPSREISLEPPEWACLTEEGVTTWNRLAPMVHHNGLLTEADLNQFARYCDMLPRWYKMKCFLDEHGETYEVMKPIYANNILEEYIVAKVAMRPQTKLYLEFNKALQAFEAEFGLSPSSRTRIQAVDDEHDPSELDFYFGGRQRA
jgi:P27 family predicted phage terminase small subunit